MGNFLCDNPVGIKKQKAKRAIGTWCINTFAKKRGRVEERAKEASPTSRTTPAST